MTNKSDGSAAEYTGGKVNYYEVEITHPTREGRDPYIAECNDIIEALGLSFSEGEAFKAIWRKGAARIKPGKRGHDGGLYDAEKARFYGQRMEVIERFSIGKPQPMPATFGHQNMIDPSSVEFSEEPAAAMQDDSMRMQLVGRYGEMAEHVYPAIDAAKEPQRARHQCLACGLGHATHLCGAGR